MLELYQHLPEHINPIALSIGSFSIHWYSLMYLVAFATVYFLLAYRIREKENTFEINKNQLFDLSIYLIIGLLLGARLGYVIFYNPSYYFHNLLEIILPVQVASGNLQFTGFYGMSYYGGLIGVLIAGFIFSKKQKINFWQLADFAIPAIPAGYLFGRIGNFLNDELYGRITEKPWGMYFPTDSLGFLRHPSQLYEAFFEGLVIFIILWSIRNSLQVIPPNRDPAKAMAGYKLQVYLFIYGLFRLFIEFFREPDPQIGLILSIFTLGQLFSLVLVFIAIVLFLKSTKKPKVIEIKPR